MKKTIILYLLFAITILCQCNSKKDTSLISATYILETIDDKNIKVTFLLKNNDTKDYFIPFIKPAYKYSEFSDRKSAKIVQWGIDPDYYLTEKILTKKDLFETGQGDSMYYDNNKDTMYFYFEEPYVKKYYDKILTDYKDKKELYFIYPNFYHAIGSGCVYIPKGETRKIIQYVYHYYPLELNDLVVGFDFNTDSISWYQEDFFKYVPQNIETYKLFKGQIKLIP